MIRSRTFSVVLLGALALSPVLAVACGGNEHFGGPPPCVGPQCVDGGGPVSLVPPTNVPSADAGTDDASASASAAPSGTVPMARASADAIDQGIEVAIRQHALKVAPKGALPDPLVVRVDLNEGEHFGATYTLQPNSCYTIVAAGVPGVVKELEVRLLLPPFFTMEAGKGKGQPAVIGKLPTTICPISPIPIPYKVDVAATKGAGRVNVMMFGKPR